MYHDWEEHQIEEKVSVNRCKSCGAVKMVFLDNEAEVYIKGEKSCKFI